jgi:hypothetical protein
MKQPGRARRSRSISTPTGTRRSSCKAAALWAPIRQAHIAPCWKRASARIGSPASQIGAITSAIIAGNPVEQQVPRLREFWETITTEIWSPWPTSCRTRHNTDQIARAQKLRSAIDRLLSKLPEYLAAEPEMAVLSQYRSEAVMRIVQLIYEGKAYETFSEDYEFSQLSMREHWKAGYDNVVETLSLLTG